MCTYVKFLQKVWENDAILQLEMYWQGIKTKFRSKFQQYLQKLFNKNLLTARQLFEYHLKHLIIIQFSKWPRDEIPKHSREF